MKGKFNQAASHPLQAWEWGEFREKTGLKVIRLEPGFQLTVHPIPKLPYTIIYLAKSKLPTPSLIKKIKEIGQENKAIFVKIEPNINFPARQPTPEAKKAKKFLNQYCQKAKANFYRYTFQVNLKPSAEEVLKRMKSKTRYNIRVSQRHDVKVVRDNSKKAFENYLNLMWETTQRQGFYAHAKKYHQLLWETFKDTDIYHLFLARYKNQTLATYVFFVFNNVLYYPYGASSREHRKVMAPHALFWEAIKFGKEKSCRTFDVWGNLGPEPSPKHPWFGVHRFKAGFGGQLMESIGAYDLIINPQLYQLYKAANKLRWLFLRAKRRF